MFDSFLLQQGATSMLDARDAMLAADQMRFDGDNQKALWMAFAQNGMGKDAKTKDGDDGQPEARLPGRRDQVGDREVRTACRGREGRPVARGQVFIGR